MSLSLSPSISLPFTFLSLPSTLPPKPKPAHLSFPSSTPLSLLSLTNKCPDFRVFSDDTDADGGPPDDFGFYDEDPEDRENKTDFDPEYEPLTIATTSRAAAATAASAGAGADEEIAFAQSKSFVSTQGWDFDTVVNYKINEDEFHKICLLDCDFFIRRPPDPDNDVYDFREMYVTPPDTDVYSIPKVLAPMPNKYIRCTMSDYGCYHVTEPPIDRLRDPMYKSEREVWKVFLKKHYRNRRVSDPEFVLDFEEIYVIDSKTKSITRAKVLVTILAGPNRDRKCDLLVVGDNGNCFKIIDMSEKPHPSAVIAREDWEKTRKDMERHLSKLRDFNVSNWF